MREDIVRIKDRLLMEHKWIEAVAIKYISLALSKYTAGEVDYEKHIHNFLKILEEELLRPHHMFEEGKVFPLFPDDPRINEFIKEHEEAHRLIDSLKNERKISILKKLLDLELHHLTEEDNYLIPKLDELIEGY